MRSKQNPVIVTGRHTMKRESPEKFIYSVQIEDNKRKGYK